MFDSGPFLCGTEGLWGIFWWGTALCVSRPCTKALLPGPSGWLLWKIWENADPSSHGKRPGGASPPEVQKKRGTGNCCQLRGQGMPCRRARWVPAKAQVRGREADELVWEEGCRGSVKRFANALHWGGHEISSRVKQEIALANFMVHKNPGCKPKRLWWSVLRWLRPLAVCYFTVSLFLILFFF